MPKRACCIYVNAGLKGLKKNQVDSSIRYGATVKSLFVAYKQHWATTLLLLISNMYLHVAYKQHGTSRDRPFITKTPYPCYLYATWGIKGQTFYYKNTIPMLLISNMGHQHYTCFFFKHYTHVFQACDWDIKTSLKQGCNMKIDPLWVKYRCFKQKFGS